MDKFNSNDYRRGYDNGYNDGKNGRDKSYVKGGLSVKYFVFGSEAYKTYCEGYNEGYRKGCLDRNRNR